MNNLMYNLWEIASHLNDIDSNCSSSCSLQCRNLHAQAMGCVHAFSFFFFPLKKFFFFSKVNGKNCTPKLCKKKNIGRHACSRAKDHRTLLSGPWNEKQYPVLRLQGCSFPWLHDFHAQFGMCGAKLRK